MAEFDSIASLYAHLGLTPSTQVVDGQVLVLGEGPVTYETEMVESVQGQGPARFEQEVEVAGDKFTEDDLREYVVNLQPDELLTLQQSLFSNGYYGTIESITEIEDPIKTGRALQSAARDSAIAYEQGASPGMESVPTLEGRFAEFTLEDLDAAKDEYLQQEAQPTIRVMPSSAVDRMVEETWRKLLGRKPTAEERRAAFGAVRAAQVAGGNAMQGGGVVESVDVTGILEGQAETADPARAGAMSLSSSAATLKRVLGFK
tara:strand:- start:16042 stop:16821 length:780 start_codon:yes stop_codon:yes gene_type:complete